MNELLTARVVARNEVNFWAMNVQQNLLEFLAPFVGQKILKADGSLLSKIKKDFPNLGETEGLRICQDVTSPFSLVWKVDVHKSIVSAYACTYEECRVYIGKLNDNVLESLCEFDQRRVDYTVEEILDLREEHDTAQKAVDKARSALSPFGPNDNH